MQTQAHTRTHTHSPCSHLPFRRGCGYLAADRWLPPSSQWLTCFPLWQQMVQPPLHYSCSFFLLICPCFSSLATCLSLLILPVSMSLLVLVSVPFFGLLALLPPPCVCASLFDVLKDVCVISRTACFSLSVSPNRESSELFCLCQRLCVCCLFWSC